MAKYRDAIEWIAETYEDVWGLETGDEDAALKLTAHLWKKEIVTVLVDVENEIWERDNDTRGNG